MLLYNKNCGLWQIFLIMVQNFILCIDLCIYEFIQSLLSSTMSSVVNYRLCEIHIIYVFNWLWNECAHILNGGRALRVFFLLLLNLLLMLCYACQFSLLYSTTRPYFVHCLLMMEECRGNHASLFYICAVCSKWQIFNPPLPLLITIITFC